MPPSVSNSLSYASLLGKHFFVDNKHFKRTVKKVYVLNDGDVIIECSMGNYYPLRECVFVVSVIS